MAWPRLSPKNLGSHLPALVAAILSTVLMTWPLSAQAGFHVLKGIYYWDAYTNAMIMGSRVDAVLGRGPLSLYDNYFFAPLPDSLVFNENLFALSGIFAPFYLLSNNPLWAYNVTLLVSLVLSVFFTYLLVRRLTGDNFAGLLAGIAFAFSPYVMFEIGRIQLVATQWIPLCFLMLHRAVEGGRRRDILGFGVCFLLQLGTCLYYAMFLVPLLATAWTVLCMKARPSLRFYVTFGLTGLAVGLLALLVLRPYFSVREYFQLERSFNFASLYDGKLSYFLNVHPTNHTLTALHHSPNIKVALEQVAFPGLTALTMSFVGVVGPLRTSLEGLNRAGVVRFIGRAVVLATVGVLLALLTRSALPAVALIGAWLLTEGRKHLAPLLPRHVAFYLGMLGLAVVLFLGLVLGHFRGKPVLGLYYYFYEYFPGFDGMRKVSRQAVMTSLLIAVLAGFGTAWFLERYRNYRVALSSLLTLGILLELRCFPHPLEDAWAGSDVPSLYSYLRKVPEKDLVASVPQNEGTRIFRGDAGLTLHNYLMLYHKHRSLNGQSSWQPAVTALVDQALKTLPQEAPRRVLQSLGLRHLIVHGGDLPMRSRGLPRLLGEQSTFFRREFSEGNDAVFELLPSGDPSLALMETPELPGSARLVPRGVLRATASVEAKSASLAMDGDPRSAWSTVRGQRRGDTLEFVLSEPRELVALELENSKNPVQLPLSFEVSVVLGDGVSVPVFSAPKVRVPRDLVYSPRKYRTRVIFPAAVRASRVRVTISEPLPGWPFAVQEAQLFER